MSTSPYPVPCLPFLQLPTLLKGIIVHELLHSIGFYHEQARPDRDQFITVDYSNIKEDRNARYQFQIYNGRMEEIGHFDFDSVMMYAPDYPQIAKDPNRPYMIPKFNVQENLRRMGQRNGLSLEDVRKIRIAYCGAANEI